MPVRPGRQDALDVRTPITPQRHGDVGSGASATHPRRHPEESDKHKAMKERIARTASRRGLKVQTEARSEDGRVITDVLVTGAVGRIGWEAQVLPHHRKHRTRAFRQSPRPQHHTPLGDHRRGLRRGRPRPAAAQTPTTKTPAPPRPHDTDKPRSAHQPQFRKTTHGHHTRRPRTPLGRGVSAGRLRPPRSRGRRTAPLPAVVNMVWQPLGSTT